jgi:hypothetical protein
MALSSVVRLVFILLCILPAGCGKQVTRVISSGSDSGPRGGLDPQVLGHGMADDSPAWAPDGASIAFHRAFPSTYGPPGVYVLSLRSHTVRLLAAGDWTGPRYLCFSPDGRRLAGVWRSQLAILDAGSGAISWPFFTESGVWNPDWSPDGRRILYHRGPTQGDYPPDSSGIHIFDLLTGEDHAVWAGSHRLAGWPMRWSPDASRFAFIDAPPGYWRSVSVYSFGDTAATMLMGTTSSLYDWLHWYTNPRHRTDGLLFIEKTGPQMTTHLIDSRTGSPLPWPYSLGPWDAPSPDGQWLVLVRAQPGDSIGVLFLRAVDDLCGRTRRQLTRYVPLADSQPLSQGDANDELPSGGG